MHPGTYHDSQAEAERTNLDEHATQRRPLGYTYRTLAERLEREGALRRGDPPNRIAKRRGPCRRGATAARSRPVPLACGPARRSAPRLLA